MIVTSRYMAVSVINWIMLYWLPLRSREIAACMGLYPMLENSITSPLSRGSSKTPWSLVKVPWLRPTTLTVTPGIPLRLSDVITNPYTCMTESLSLSNCARAKNGLDKTIIYSKAFFIRSTFWNVYHFYQNPGFTDSSDHSSVFHVDQANPIKRCSYHLFQKEQRLQDCDQGYLIIIQSRSQN